MLNGFATVISRERSGLDMLCCTAGITIGAGRDDPLRVAAASGSGTVELPTSVGSDDCSHAALAVCAAIVRAADEVGTAALHPRVRNGLPILGHDWLVPPRVGR